ncbi:MAG: Hpt domain-containing protein [Pseudomonadales bacterium]|nr:Hpt domain-containing protein [Pseudomonadales bacterium]
MSELLDKALLSELKDIMEESFPDLLDSYITESDKQYQELRTSWSEKDIEQLGRQAHTLKGSCSNMGASSMAEMCSELERGAKNNILDGMEEVMQELSTLHFAVLDEIKELRLNC